MAKTHDWGTKLKNGEWWEHVYDEMWREGQGVSQILPVTKEDQLEKGIDRHYAVIGEFSGALYGVEYKTDHMAAKTGNFFVEVYSQVTTDGKVKKGGWAVHSQADVLIVGFPDLGQVVSMNMGKFKEHLVEWMGKYPSRTAMNRGYFSIGVLVPLGPLKRLGNVKPMKAGAIMAVEEKYGKEPRRD